MKGELAALAKTFDDVKWNSMLTTFKSHISINYIVNYLLDLFKKKKKSRRANRQLVKQLIHMKCGA